MLRSSICLNIPVLIDDATIQSLVKAIGVTAAGMVRPKALRDAGADFIIERFTNETIRKFYDFVNT